MNFKFEEHGAMIDGIIGFEIELPGCGRFSRSALHTDNQFSATIWKWPRNGNKMPVSMSNITLNTETFNTKLPEINYCSGLLFDFFSFKLNFRVFW